MFGVECRDSHNIHFFRKVFFFLFSFSKMKSKLFQNFRSKWNFSTLLNPTVFNRWKKSIFLIRCVYQLNGPNFSFFRSNFCEHNSTVLLTLNRVFVTIFFLCLCLFLFDGALNMRIVQVYLLRHMLPEIDTLRSARKIKRNIRNNIISAMT